VSLTVLGGNKDLLETTTNVVNKILKKLILMAPHLYKKASEKVS